MIHVRDYVRVVRLDDGCGDPDRVGQRGTVVQRLMDNGATPADPLFLILFKDGEKDAFWNTEVEACW